MEPLVPLNYSIPEASRLLGIGRSKLYTLIADGYLGVVRIGTRTLIPRTEIENFQASIIAKGAISRVAK